MFGLHIFLQNIVRQRRFLNYEHKGMRSESPQHACLRLT